MSSPYLSRLDPFIMKKIHSLLIGIFLFGIQPLSAQYRHEWTAFLGVANYQGDLPEPHFEVVESRLAAGLIYRYHWHPQWSLRAQLIVGQIRGDDRHAQSRASRQFRFSSSLIESAFAVEWKPFGRQSHYYVGKFRPHWGPYVFLGLGLTQADPRATCYRTDLPKEVDPFASEMRQTLFLAVPVGLGIRYDWSPHWSVGLEVGQRPVFSDLLDGVSVSGNPDKDDWYVFSGLTISWLIGAHHYRDINAGL